MHWGAFAFVRDAASRLGPVARVLEVGSRDINGDVRGCFLAETYTGIDLTPGPGVDVVADGATYAVADPLDVAVCCEVLEHTPEAEAILRNLAQQLRRGGALVVTAAGLMRAPHSAVDGGPLRSGEYYRNVSPEMLRTWLNACAVPWAETAISTGAGGADLYLLAVRA